MKVRLDGGQIVQVSKKIAVEKANGESVGMIRFSNAGARKLKHVLDTMVRDEDNKNVFWLSAIQHIIDEGFPVHPHVCDHSDWAEIDFHPDFEMIQSNLSRYSEMAAKWRDPLVVNQDSSVKTAPVFVGNPATVESAS
jgi:choline kinase